MAEQQYSGILKRGAAALNAIVNRAPHHVGVELEVLSAKTHLYDIDLRCRIWAWTPGNGMGGGRAAVAYGEVVFHRTTSGRWENESPHSVEEWGVVLAHPASPSCDVFTGPAVVEGLKTVARARIETRGLDALCGFEPKPAQSLGGWSRPAELPGWDDESPDLIWVGEYASPAITEEVDSIADSRWVVAATGDTRDP